MPRGALLDETGWLNHRTDGYALRRDGGGTWRLDVGLWQGLRVRRLVGQRVRVLGRRAEFDVIDVERIVVEQSIRQPATRKITP